MDLTKLIEWEKDLKGALAVVDPVIYPYSSAVLQKELVKIKEEREKAERKLKEVVK